MSRFYFLVEQKGLKSRVNQRLQRLRFLCRFCSFRQKARSVSNDTFYVVISSNCEVFFTQDFICNIQNKIHVTNLDEFRPELTLATANEYFVSPVPEFTISQVCTQHIRNCELMHKTIWAQSKLKMSENHRHFRKTVENMRFLTGDASREIRQWKIRL